MRALLVIGLFLSACARDGLGGGGELGERFIGLWAIDQPYHAGYERTLYFFNALDGEGVLSVVDTEWLGSECRYSGRECVTGFVVDEAGRYCEFGERWHSSGDTLLIAGRCDDETTREIALELPDDRGRNTEGTQPISISVDGDTSFGHHPEWRFTRCQDSSTSYACNGMP